MARNWSKQTLAKRNAKTHILVHLLNSGSKQLSRLFPALFFWYSPIIVQPSLKLSDWWTQPRHNVGYLTTIFFKLLKIFHLIWSIWQPRGRAEHAGSYGSGNFDCRRWLSSVLFVKRPGANSLWTTKEVISDKTDCSRKVRRQNRRLKHSGWKYRKEEEVEEKLFSTLQHVEEKGWTKVENVCIAWQVMDSKLEHACFQKINLNICLIVCFNPWKMSNCPLPVTRCNRGWRRPIWLR